MKIKIAHAPAAQWAEDIDVGKPGIGTWIAHEDPVVQTLGDGAGIGGWNR